MKIQRSNFIKTCLFAFLHISILDLFAGDIIIRKDDDPLPPIPIPRSSAYIPVTATEDNQTLEIYFLNVLGSVTIKVYDIYNQAVYADQIDTASVSEAMVDISGWVTGDYVLKIVYGTNQLSGNFSIE